MANIRDAILKNLTPHFDLNEDDVQFQILENHFNPTSLEDLAVPVKSSPSDTSTIAWIPPAEVAQCQDETFKSGMIALADQLVETSDQKGDALVARAQLLVALGDHKRALHDLDQATEHFAHAAPSFDECYRRYSAALLCLKLGDHEKYRELVQALQQRCKR